MKYGTVNKITQRVLTAINPNRFKEMQIRWPINQEKRIAKKLAKT